MHLNSLKAGASTSAFNAEEMDAQNRTCSYDNLATLGGIALGPMSANVSRLGVILLSIVITVWFARRRGGRQIKGVTWIWQPLS
ncbi:MAG: hypothetical protein AAFY34_03735 [Pseudomonadota bacterium]